MFCYLCSSLSLYISLSPCPPIISLFHMLTMSSSFSPFFRHIYLFTIYFLCVPFLYLFLLPPFSSFFLLSHCLSSYSSFVCVRWVWHCCHGDPHPLLPYEIPEAGSWAIQPRWWQWLSATGEVKTKQNKELFAIRLATAKSRVTVIKFAFPRPCMLR